MFFYFLSFDFKGRMKTPSSAYISSYNDVTTDNLSECVYELLNKLKNASHMAIDFEFTGLCKPTAIDMNHRYIAMKEAVEKYSIVSFGVSIMKQIESDHDEPKNSIRYECDNFNFLTKKESRIVFQEGNVEFLASTGFSFDKLNRMGIPFTPPGDIGKDDNFLYNKQKPRDTRLLKLWKAILGMLQYNNIPVIVHNGLHDIMYLYHSFIDKLPNNFTVFLTNLSQHFPSGFYDTKLLSIEIEFSANFLSYVFAKTDRLRQNRFANSTAKEPYFEVILNKPIVSSEDDKSNHSIETTTEVTVVTSVTETNQTEASQQPTVTTSTDRKRKKDETVEVNTLSIVNNNKKQKTKEADFCKAFAVSVLYKCDYITTNAFHRRKVGVRFHAQEIWIIAIQVGCTTYNVFWTLRWALRYTHKYILQMQCK